jgi:O-antigen/teichoic acid export membrane protein
VLSVGMLTYYSVPFDLVSKMIIFPACIVPSLFPYFSYHGSRKSSEVSEVTSRTIKYLLLVLTPLAAIFAFFAKDILRLWLNPQFASQSTVAMQIVTMIFFFNAFAMVPFTSVQALGRPDLKAILDVTVLPVYALVAWWLMRRLGINGAALAKLLITLADLAFLYTFASRLKAFSFRDCVSGPLSRALLASGGLVFAIALIESFHARLFVSAIFVALCILCYAAIFWAVAVDEEDRVTIGGLSQRALALVRGRETNPAVQMTGNDAGV